MITFWIWGAILFHGVPPLAPGKIGRLWVCAKHYELWARSEAEVIMKDDGVTLWVGGNVAKQDYKQDLTQWMLISQRTNESSLAALA